MKAWSSLGVCLGAIVCGGPGCGGTTTLAERDAGTDAGHVVAANDAGEVVGDGDAGSDAGTSPCEDYWQTLASLGCPGTINPPGAEAARVLPRWNKFCEQFITLPGTSFDVSTLEACTAAMKSSGCQDPATPNPCYPSTGSRTAGASCADPLQCQTGECTAGSVGANGEAAACGTCVPAAAVGQACTGPCAPDAACLPGSGGTSTCVAVTFGAAGASCNGATTQCSGSLVCNTVEAKCAAPAGAGAPCGADQDCAFPLICPAASGTSTCKSPGSIGAPCSSAFDCADGMNCPASSHTCAAPTWASAGQPCSDNVLCLVGECPPSGVCPAVIADGQPCKANDATAVCDTWAQCLGGVCVLGEPSCP
jgi:hypothetical protein